MKKLIILVAIILSSVLSLQSQSITIENNSTGLPCHYINVVITASGFPTNIGSVYLVIDIDLNVVQYVSRIIGTLPSGGLAVGPEDSHITIQWTSPIGNTGININGTLITLVMHYDGGTSTLDWNDPSCQVFLLSDLNNPIPMTLVNGTVSPGPHTFNTYHVDQANGNDGNSGLSWGSAFKTISRAAGIPPKAGEQVLIKPNTYNEKVIIKSNAGYAVRPTPGVILSDTNKITFPGGANLACVNLASYPDQYYAYVYRSWSSNNGYYKVIEVNDAQNYVRVEGASFIPETGVANNRNYVTAAVGRPVIYKKDPASLESQRVIVKAPSGTTFDAFYIGIADGNGQTIADSCNWNIIEGIDIENNLNITGLHIQCSQYNVFSKGKIYFTSPATGDTGIIIRGHANQKGKNARYNIIQNNEIYNTKPVGVLIGYTTAGSSATFNNAHFNSIIDNNIYVSTGTLALLNNAVRVESNNKSNVIEGNNFHDIKIWQQNNGAIFLKDRVDSTLVYNNILRNIGKDASNSGLNACIVIDSTSSKVHVYNNIIYNDDTVTNAVYAFRINGRAHNGSKVAFNTIYKIDNGFYLKDNSAGTINFAIQNNIISPTTSTIITNNGTTGRFTVTYNLFRIGPGTPYESGTGNMVGDPLFIDPNGVSMYGLMLQPTSPALLFPGTPVTGITRDYIGDIRNSSLPARGAFENVMNCIWTGSSSTDWHNYLNWKYLIVPKDYTGVTIPNVTNDPVVSFTNATCKTVSLMSGASIRVVSPRTLTINN
jgi:hypothetical protein